MIKSVQLKECLIMLIANTISDSSYWYGLIGCLCFPIYNNTNRILNSSTEFYHHTTTKTHIYIDGKIIVRGSGEPVELIDNPDATNPTFAELVAFLERDPTDKYSYIVGPPKNAFICSDFAETVHNNAEAAGIRAA